MTVPKRRCPALDRFRFLAMWFASELETVRYIVKPAAIPRFSDLEGANTGHAKPNRMTARTIPAVILTSQPYVRGDLPAPFIYMSSLDRRGSDANRHSKRSSIGLELEARSGTLLRPARLLSLHPVPDCLSDCDRCARALCQGTLHRP